MVPTRLLDKYCTVARQAPGAGTATLTRIAAGVKCAFYDGGGWSPGPEGGHYTNPNTVYVLDATGKQIPGGLRPGDFLAVTVAPGNVVELIVRGIKSFNNYRITRSAFIYTANCEPAPTGNL